MVGVCVTRRAWRLLHDGFGPIVVKLPLGPSPIVYVQPQGACHSAGGVSYLCKGTLLPIVDDWPPHGYGYGLLLTTQNYHVPHIPLHIPAILCITTHMHHGGRSCGQSVCRQAPSLWLWCPVDAFSSCLYPFGRRPPSPLLVGAWFPVIFLAHPIGLVPLGTVQPFMGFKFHRGLCARRKAVLELDLTHVIFIACHFASASEVGPRPPLRLPLAFYTPYYFYIETSIYICVSPLLMVPSTGQCPVTLGIYQFTLNFHICSILASSVCCLCHPGCQAFLPLADSAYYIGQSLSHCLVFPSPHFDCCSLAFMVRILVCDIPLHTTLAYLVFCAAAAGLPSARPLGPGGRLPALDSPLLTQAQRLGVVHLCTCFVLFTWSTTLGLGWLMWVLPC
jgi:hypothetical protein